jgi:hypothetical protein
MHHIPRPDSTHEGKFDISGFISGGFLNNQKIYIANNSRRNTALAPF